MVGERMAPGVPEPMVGDEVLIRATVLRWEPTVGALVELFSKTDQYEAWVRPELITEVVVPNLPGEPADGTWLGGEDPHSGNARFFARNDAEGHFDPDRRRNRHWWDVVAEEWIDWPAAVRRGANPLRVMREVASDGR